MQTAWLALAVSAVACYGILDYYVHLKRKETDVWKQVSSPEQSSVL